MNVDATRRFSSGGADLLFEVPPDEKLFDSVRSSVIKSIRSDYTSVIHGPVRESVRLQSIEITPTGWDVSGRFETDDPFQFQATVDPDADCRDAVLSHVFDYIDDNLVAVDANGVTIDTVSVRPHIWFADCKVPLSDHKDR